MSDKTVPITLITSASEALCQSMQDSLVYLGYTDISTLDLNKVSDVDSSRRSVFVVPLHFADNSPRPINFNTFFAQNHDKPILGVIPNSTDKWSKDALAFCNEFLYWPCEENEIYLRINRVARLLQTHHSLKAGGSILDEFLSLNMVGSSPPFLHVLQQIKKISRYDAPVLLEGETGTGKELAARAIHYLSPRKDLPFIPINCGAIPDNLIENELFGHEKGAYTDAKNSQEGIVSLANHGSVFFDEVEALTLKGQVVLLRFLDDQIYKPLGAERSCKANVRIMAASNKHLPQLAELGLFRKDLLYRLNIVKITMPSLSERSEDIVVLAEYFLHKFQLQYNQQDKYFHPETLHWFRTREWPGNVRELENLVHREFLLAEGPCITCDEISSIYPNRRKNKIDRRQEPYLKINMKEAKAEIIRRFEREYLTRLLDETNGNVTRAAEKAGKERRSLGKLIKKHGIV